MKKKLIVTAIDFGLCDSVNEGILWCLNHKNNIITNLALIPNALASQDAVDKVKGSDLEISLNTTFTTGRPLSPDVSSLVDNQGNFLKVNTDNWDFSALGQYEKADLKVELDAQWDWFIKQFGKKPGALLSRKNEFADPLLLELFVNKAREENVPVRTPVWRWQTNYSAQSYVNQSKVKSTTGVFVGILDWNEKFGYDLEKDLERLVHDISDSPGEYSELLVYPGFVDRTLFKESSVNWQRGQFLKVMQKGEFTKAIKDNFELISFKDIK